MPNQKGYHRLKIIGKLKDFIYHIYKITGNFPKSEFFGLTSQIRRASVSILLNIVEGDRRKSKKEFLRFLEIADASLAEVEIALELAHHLGLLTEKNYQMIEKERQEIAFMLIAFIKKIRQ